MANPNPKSNKATQFKKGVSGNPGGKSKETVSLERGNAAKALKLRQRMLKAMLKVSENMTEAQLIETMDAVSLKMLKDAEDRGLGAPVQPVINPGIEALPHLVELVARPIPDESTD